MKYLIIVIFVGLLFSACNDDEDITKKKKHSRVLVNKVIETKDKNTSLSDTLKDDGITIDGFKDEKLLDSFQLAVSQVMVEDGVSVPNCKDLSATGYISLEDCEDITNKYFGFYEIDESGNASKVDNLFKNGVKGAEIEIKEGEVEFFDSSGNPLLDNEVEFEETVDNSNDLGFLNKLENTIPTNKIEFKEKIKARIDFLKESKASEEREILQTARANEVKSKKKEKISNDDFIATPNAEVNNDLKDANSNLSTWKTTLKKLNSEHERTIVRLENNPDSSIFQNKSENELILINEAEVQIDYYSSLVESYAK